MNETAWRRKIPDFQDTDHTLGKGKALFASYLEQIDLKDKAARLRIKTIISESCENFVLDYEHCITTEAIRAMLRDLTSPPKVMTPYDTRI